MGLKAVANPAAGGQPGSFTTLTVTGAATIGGGLAVTGSISATAAGAIRTINATSDYTALQMGTASTVYGQIGWGTGGELVYNSAAGATRQHVFQIGGSNRAVIDGAGLAVTGSISATTSVRPQADPDTNWGIDFAQSNMVPNCLTIADTATYDLAAGSGFIVLQSNTNGNAGVFLAAAGAVTAIADPGSQFSTTVNTPAKINIYYNGTTAYRIQNNTGGAIELFVAGIRTRTNT